ncbi:WD40-repeat-containing domain protein, partial [Mycena galopus ATCC 62051]
HDGTTFGIKFTALFSEGRRLVYGLFRGEIRVLDVITGKVLSAFNVQVKSKLYCGALAPDDRTIICGFQDGLVQTWDINSQLPLSQTPPDTKHGDAVYAVAFARTKPMVISGSGDSAIRMWSFQGVHKITFHGHRDAVSSVAFSPDDSKIVSGSMDGTMKIWDSSTACALVTCRHSPNEGVYAVAFSHQSNRIATGSHRRNIRTWDSETGSEVMEPLSLHRGPVLALLFSPSDKTIISGSRDRQIRIW